MYDDPSKQRQMLGKSVTTRIHNEINESILNRSKKLSLYRSEGHNRTNYSYTQVDY